MAEESAMQQDEEKQKPSADEKAHDTESKTGAQGATAAHDSSPHTESESDSDDDVFSKPIRLRGQQVPPPPVSSILATQQSGDAHGRLGARPNIVHRRRGNTQLVIGTTGTRPRVLPRLSTPVSRRSSRANSPLSVTPEMDDETYIDKHHITDLIARLAFAILESKPVDHVAFARSWVRSQMRDGSHAANSPLIAGKPHSTTGHHRLHVSKADDAGSEAGSRHGFASVAAHEAATTTPQPSPPPQSSRPPRHGGVQRSAPVTPITTALAPRTVVFAAPSPAATSPTAAASSSNNTTTAHDHHHSHHGAGHHHQHQHQHYAQHAHAEPTHAHSLTLTPHRHHAGNPHRPDDDATTAAVSPPREGTATATTDAAASPTTIASSRAASVEAATADASGCLSTSRLCESDGHYYHTAPVSEVGEEDASAPPTPSATRPAAAHASHPSHGLSRYSSTAPSLTAASETNGRAGRSDSSASSSPMRRLSPTHPSRSTTAAGNETGAVPVMQVVATAAAGGDGVTRGRQQEQEQPAHKEEKQDVVPSNIQVCDTESPSAALPSASASPSIGTGTVAAATPCNATFEGGAANEAASAEQGIDFAEFAPIMCFDSATKGVVDLREVSPATAGALAKTGIPASFFAGHGRHGLGGFGKSALPGPLLADIAPPTPLSDLDGGSPINTAHEAAVGTAAAGYGYRGGGGGGSPGIAAGGRAGNAANDTFGGAFSSPSAVHPSTTATMTGLGGGTRINLHMLASAGATGTPGAAPPPTPRPSRGGLVPPTPPPASATRPSSQNATYPIVVTADGTACGVMMMSSPPPSTATTGGGVVRAGRGLRSVLTTPTSSADNVVQTGHVASSAGSATPSPVLQSRPPFPAAAASRDATASATRLAEGNAGAAAPVVSDTGTNHSLSQGTGGTTSTQADFITTPVAAAEGAVAAPSGSAAAVVAAAQGTGISAHPPAIASSSSNSTNASPAARPSTSEKDFPLPIFPVVHDTTAATIGSPSPAITSATTTTTNTVVAPSSSRPTTLGNGLRSESVRQLRSLINQLPSSKYGAALVFLEGLLEKQDAEDNFGSSTYEVDSRRGTEVAVLSSNSNNVLSEPERVTLGGGTVAMAATVGGDVIGTAANAYRRHAAKDTTLAGAAAAGTATSHTAMSTVSTGAIPSTTPPSAALSSVSAGQRLATTVAARPTSSSHHHTLSNASSSAGTAGPSAPAMSAAVCMSGNTIIATTDSAVCPYRPSSYGASEDRPSDTAATITGPQTGLAGEVGGGSSGSSGSSSSEDDDYDGDEDEATMRDEGRAALGGNAVRTRHSARLAAAASQRQGRASVEAIVKDALSQSVLQSLTPSHIKDDTLALSRNVNGAASMNSVLMAKRMQMPALSMDTVGSRERGGAAGLMPGSRPSSRHVSRTNSPLGLGRGDFGQRDATASSGAFLPGEAHARRPRSEAGGGGRALGSTTYSSSSVGASPVGAASSQTSLLCAQMATGSQHGVPPPSPATAEPAAPPRTASPPMSTPPPLQSSRWPKSAAGNLSGRAGGLPLHSSSASSAVQSPAAPLPFTPHPSPPPPPPAMAAGATGRSVALMPQAMRSMMSSSDSSSSVGSTRRMQETHSLTPPSEPPSLPLRSTEAVDPSHAGSDLDEAATAGTTAAQTNKGNTLLRRPTTPPLRRSSSAVAAYADPIIALSRQGSTETLRTHSDDAMVAAEVISDTTSETRREEGEDNDRGAERAAARRRRRGGGVKRVRRQVTAAPLKTPTQRDVEDEGGVRRDTTTLSFSPRAGVTMTSAPATSSAFPTLALPGARHSATAAAVDSASSEEGNLLSTESSSDTAAAREQELPSQQQQQRRLQSTTTSSSATALTSIANVTTSSSSNAPNRHRRHGDNGDNDDDDVFATTRTAPSTTAAGADGDDDDAEGKDELQGGAAAARRGDTATQSMPLLASHSPPATCRRAHRLTELPELHPTQPALTPLQRHHMQHDPARHASAQRRQLGHPETETWLPAKKASGLRRHHTYAALYQGGTPPLPSSSSVTEHTVTLSPSSTTRQARHKTITPRRATMTDFLLPHSDADDQIEARHARALRRATTSLDIAALQARLVRHHRRARTRTDRHGQRSHDLPATTTKTTTTAAEGTGLRRAKSSNDVATSERHGRTMLRSRSDGSLWRSSALDSVSSNSDAASLSSGAAGDDYSPLDKAVALTAAAAAEGRRSQGLSRPHRRRPHSSSNTRQAVSLPEQRRLTERAHARHRDDDDSLATPWHARKGDGGRRVGGRRSRQDSTQPTSSFTDTEMIHSAPVVLDATSLSELVSTSLPSPPQNQPQEAMLAGQPRDVAAAGERAAGGGGAGLPRRATSGLSAGKSSAEDEADYLGSRRTTDVTLLPQSPTGTGAAATPRASSGGEGGGLRRGGRSSSGVLRGFSSVVSVAAAMDAFHTLEGQASPEELNEVREAVEHYDPFSTLDKTQLETLVHAMTRQELREGDVVVHEGDAALDQLLLVMAGTLRVERTGVAARTAQKGEFVGKIEVLYNMEKSHVTIRVASPTAIVYSLTKANYQKLVVYERGARRYLFLQYINQIPLFKSLSMPNRIRLADGFRVCRIPQGTLLTQRDHPVEWMYLILSGQVTMSCGNNTTTASTTAGGGGAQSGSAQRSGAASTPASGGATALCAGAGPEDDGHAAHDAKHIASEPLQPPGSPSALPVTGALTPDSGRSSLDSANAGAVIEVSDLLAAAPARGGGSSASSTPHSPGLASSGAVGIERSAILNTTVIERSSGDLVGESEFVFKCGALFNATATTALHAARMNRLHFEVIISREALAQMKSFMVSHPAYHFFESIAPEPVKAEMRQVALRRSMHEESQQQQQQQGPRQQTHRRRHTLHRHASRDVSHGTPMAPGLSRYGTARASVFGRSLDRMPSALDGLDHGGRGTTGGGRALLAMHASPTQSPGLDSHMSGGTAATGMATSPPNETAEVAAMSLSHARHNRPRSSTRHSVSSEHWRRVSTDGELIYSGSRNLYRFPAQAFWANGNIMIAVVVDGTIIRWNAVAQQVTGFAPYEVIGQSIYDLMPTQGGRQQLRERLLTAKRYAGMWDTYRGADLDQQHVFSFRQNTGLYQVGLALSVIPSNFAASAEVLLLIGREAKHRAASSYAADVARWLQDQLRPQLRQFQRRLLQIEGNKWVTTPDDALRLRGHLDACLSMVDSFMHFSALNMETVNESWRPVRLPLLIRRFIRDAAVLLQQEASHGGSTLLCNLDEVQPKTEIFLDVPQVLSVLELLLRDAVKAGANSEDSSSINHGKSGDAGVEATEGGGVTVELRVYVVEPSANGALSHAGSGAATTMTNNITAGGAATTRATSPRGGGLAAVAVTQSRPQPGDGFPRQPPPAVPGEAGVKSVVGTPVLDTERGRSAASMLPQPRRPTATTATTTTTATVPTSLSAALLAKTTALSNAGEQAAAAPQQQQQPAHSDAGSADKDTSFTQGVVRPTIDVSPYSLRRIRFELRDNGPSLHTASKPRRETVGGGTSAATCTVTDDGTNAEAAPGDGLAPTAGQRGGGAANGAPHKATSTAGSTTARSPVEQAHSNAGSGYTHISPSVPLRGAVLQQVAKTVSMMGGMLYSWTRPEVEGNVVYVELPLLAVPGSTGSEAGAEDEDDAVTGGPADRRRTFTVIVADNNRAQQNHICQILWARQHAVVPVSSFKELMRKIENNTADILIIDPLRIDITDDDYEELQSDDPFDDIRDSSLRMVLVVMGTDFSDWRLQKLLDRDGVIELPNLGSAALIHIAMQEAERMVTEMRDQQERIELIRRTFTNSSAERHKIGRLIGKGAFGDVYEVEDTLTGGKLAMKRLRLQDGVFADEIVQEILAMTSLQHENIIHYFYCEKESNTLLRLYMELAPGGTLQNKIRQNPGIGLPFEEIVQHLTDICRGLAYVHSHHYVHGDLKPANLLIGAKGRLKIGDFGTAKKLRPRQQLYKLVGTPQYMAPEVLTADSDELSGYDYKADIWSVGCIVLEMATGQAPFAHLDCTHGVGIIKYLTELTGTPDLSPLFSGNPLIYEFVKCCLDIDPQKRPSAQELLHFDILQGAVTSGRAERIVKRAEMLHKLNKYAAVRNDEGGDRAHSTDFTPNDSTEAFNEYNTLHSSTLAGSQTASSDYEGGNVNQDEMYYAGESAFFSSSISSTSSSTVSSRSSSSSSAASSSTCSSSTASSASPPQQQQQQGGHARHRHRAHHAAVTRAAATTCAARQEGITDGEGKAAADVSTTRHDSTQAPPLNT